jgi:hypothetical protein
MFKIDFETICTYIIKAVYCFHDHVALSIRGSWH